MPRPKTRNAGLRAELLSSSLDLLAREGPAAVTARRVATDANTSVAALYELFGDKAGLVRSIFFEGFAALSAVLEGLAVTGDPRTDLTATLEASRSFSIASPMLHQVMYGRPFAEFEPAPGDATAARTIYELTIARVADWLGTEPRASATIDAAQALISLNEGLIAREIAGTLGSSRSGIERRRVLAFDALLDGLASTAGGTRG